jgi:hypothetical protein
MNGDFEGESLVLKGKTGEGALQTKAAANEPPPPQ